MRRRNFVAGAALAGMWTTPVVRSARLTGTAGSPRPEPPRREAPPVAPPAADTTDGILDGTLPYTGANSARDATVAAAMIAAGTLAVSQGRTARRG